MKLVSFLVFLSAYSVTSSLVVEVPPACPKTAAEALMVSRLEDLVTCVPVNWFVSTVNWIAALSILPSAIRYRKHLTLKAVMIYVRIDDYEVHRRNCQKR